MLYDYKAAICTSDVAFIRTTDIGNSLWYRDVERAPQIRGTTLNEKSTRPYQESNPINYAITALLCGFNFGRLVFCLREYNSEFDRKNLNNHCKFHDYCYL